MAGLKNFEFNVTQAMQDGVPLLAAARKKNSDNYKQLKKTSRKLTQEQRLLVAEVKKQETELAILERKLKSELIKCVIMQQRITGSIDPNLFNQFDIFPDGKTIKETLSVVNSLSLFHSPPSGNQPLGQTYSQSNVLSFKK